jgi:hypothetical protein
LHSLMAYAALAVEVLILVQADQTVVPLDELVLRVTGDLAEEIVMGVDTAERVERCAGRVIRRVVGLAVDMDADEKVRMLVLVVHGPVPSGNALPPTDTAKSQWRDPLSWPDSPD